MKTRGSLINFCNTANGSCIVRDFVNFSLTFITSNIVFNIYLFI